MKVKSVNPEGDSFIAVDDITYKATLCTEATDGWDLGDKFFSTPILSALLHRPIYNAKVDVVAINIFRRFFRIYSLVK